jgi:hypothetical protein
MDEVLDKVIGHQVYSFLDGFSDYCARRSLKEGFAQQDGRIDSNKITI